MPHLHVTVTWRSEHIIELEGEADLANLVDALTDRSNARVVAIPRNGSTTRSMLQSTSFSARPTAQATPA